MPQNAGGSRLLRFVIWEISYLRITLIWSVMVWIKF